DVDALLEEWCDRAVGPTAGPVLAQYYRLWERHTTEVMPTSHWFQTGVGATYFGMNDASHLADLPASTMTRAAMLMDRVVRTASTTVHKARARTLAKAFDYTSLSWRSYPPKAVPPTIEAGAMALMDRIESEWPQRKAAVAAREE